MKRLLLWTIVALAFAGVCRVFPLFHVVPLERVARERRAGAFDAVQFAEKFWNETLLKSLDQAVKADVLLAGIQANPVAAKNQFSRRLGLSESYTYFVSGTGRVLAVSGDEISLAVTEGATNAEVALQTGLLFGNTVRDATGLLDVNDYPNSQDFNDISAALNRIIETRVLPKLREQVKVGAKIHFAGCAEVNDETADLKPLRVIPVRAEVQ
jgi:predicted lipoprotein